MYIYIYVYIYIYIYIYILSELIKLFFNLSKLITLSTSA